MRSVRAWTGLVAVVAVLESSAPASAFQWIERDKHSAAPPADDAELGRAVAAHGVWAIAGARREGIVPSKAGAVHVYRVGSPAVEDVVLHAADATNSDEFGTSVAIFGDLIVAGAPLDDPRASNSGSAYVFRYGPNGWVQEAKLVPADGQLADQFGASVAVSADRILIGAPRDDDRGSDAGSVYAYQYTGGQWVQTEKIAVGAAGDQFGATLALDGDVLLVGAPFDDQTAGDAGAAYVFQLTGGAWIQQIKLRAAGGAQGDRFGESVALSGDAAAVGAARVNRPGQIDCGAVYVFRQGAGGWTQEAELLAPDRAAGDFFGASVSLDGESLAIGAPGDDDNGTNSGSAYVFVYQSGPWSYSAKVMPADGAVSDTFGHSVVLRGRSLVAGAYGDDDAGTDSGSAYFFLLNRAPNCPGNAEFVAECAFPTTAIALNSAGVIDPDQDALDFQWSTTCTGASFDDASAANPTITLPSAGGCDRQCDVTLTVSDGIAPPVSCTMVVRLRDTQPPVLSCPQPIAVYNGHGVDPADTGIPEVSDCDPLVTLEYSDARDFNDCSPDPQVGEITRTWSASDSCGHTSVCTQRISLTRPVVSIDILPGACPNQRQPRGGGRITVVMLGSEELDGSMIDFSSIRLTRADCPGVECTPLTNGQGAPPVIDDQGSVVSRDLCGCASDSRDGTLDLSVSFDWNDVSNTLRLEEFEPKTVVKFLVRGVVSAPGSPLDGLAFIGSDCIEIIAPGNPAQPTRPGSNPPAHAPGSKTPLIFDPGAIPPGCGVGVALALPIIALGLGFAKRRAP